MIDFTLNQIGDIVLAPAYQYPSFTIDFYTPAGGRKYETFRIDFDTDVPRYQDPGDGFLIEFGTNLRNDLTNWISTPPVKDKTELAQEVLIRLKTELGEFEFIPSLGSKIVLEQHEDIQSAIVLEQVKQYVEEAIADIDFEEEPAVTVERIDDESRFRYETLRITIDTGKTRYFTADI